MPKWFKFTSDYDHRWPSRAVTAFKKGMVVNVKDEVAEAATAVKAGSVTDKPKKEDDDHVTTPTRVEGQRNRVVAGNPVLTNTSLEAPEPAPAPVARPNLQGGSVTGKGLSPASGGGQKPEDTPIVVETGEDGEAITGPKDTTAKLSPVQELAGGESTKTPEPPVDKGK